MSLIEAPFVWASAGLVSISDGIAKWSGNAWHEYVALGDVYRDNLQLHAEINALQEEITASRDAVVRLDTLEKNLGFSSTFPKGVLAQVIGGDASHWFDALLVDRGENVGIRSGDAVLSPLGVVGRVAKATGNTAEILAVHNRGTVIPVRVQRSRHSGILVGGLSPSTLRPLSATERAAVEGVPLVAEMRYIHRSADVLPGDVVVTSGLSGRFPPGIPVGTVVRVVREKTDAFLKVYVVPATRLDTLEQVVIIATGTPRTDAGPSVDSAVAAREQASEVSGELAGDEPEQKP
ncbi:MAG: rod shape-determining protein MreC [Nitrospirota bacterium]|nr:rod shape-determining protein MreC [Nitrospirota bacterium]